MAHAESIFIGSLPGPRSRAVSGATPALSLGARVAIAPTLAIVAVIATGCGLDATTEVSVVLPEDDDVAAAALVAMDVEVWNGDSGACRALLDWRVTSCGLADCTPPALGPGGSLPDRRERSLKGPDGWQSLHLPGAGDGPWEIVVTGYDGEDGAFLWGCTRITAGSGAEVILFRPFCDESACASRYHPACDAHVACDGIAPVTASTPVPCQAPSETVEVWEQDGVACNIAMNPDGTDAWPPPCHPARFACDGSSATPIEDGLCPGGDGRACNPAATCSEGSAGGTCMAPSQCCGGTCVDTWSSPEHCGECFRNCRDVGARECIEGICGGGSPTCADRQLMVCNEARQATVPRADGCAMDGGCACGDGPPCADEPLAACCGGRCIQVGTEAACSGCDDRCAPDRRCIGGMCA